MQNFKANSIWIILVCLLSSANASAQSPSSNLPLVFDPQTKKYFIGGSSKFTLKAGDQSGLIDRIEVAIDNGEYRPYNQAIEFKEEGKHTLKFRAINPVNNWSPVQFVEVFVDLTAPTTEAKLPDEHSSKDETGTFVGMSSKITLAAQDNMSGIQTVDYSWDGVNFSPYEKPIAVEKPGKQTLYYRSLDKVGNAEPVKRLDFTADGTAPTSEVKLNGPNKPAVMGGKTYVSDGMSFVISSHDDISKVKQTWVVLDGKPQMYLKPVFFLEEGPHTIEYYSVDNVGNKEASKSLAVYTVSTPPRTSATPVGKIVNMGGTNYANRDFQLKFEVKDNVVGAERVEVKVDSDADFRLYLDPIRFTTPGLHNVMYRAVDRTGNLEPAKSYVVNVVDSIPETKISTAQPLTIRDGITYSPSPNVVTFNVSSSSGVGIDNTLLSINGGAFQSYRGPITLTNDQPIYKITYKSVDKLGNEEQGKTAVFHMIRNVPVVDLFITNGKSSEEQVRTNYLDHGPGTEAPQGRLPASVKGKKK